MAARAIPGTSHGYETQKNKESGEKKCHITVGEVIFQIEHGQYKNLEQLVSLLIVVWSCLANRIDSFQDVQSVFQFIYSETGRAIFLKAFTEINQNYKRGLSRILVQCSEVLENKVPNAAKLCSSLVMCIYDPWSDPAICEVINNEDVHENLVADFVSLEPVELLLLRIESLVSVGSENSAIRLCRFCLKSESLAHAVKQQQQKESFCLVENWKLPFIEWLLRILFRKRLLNEFVAESAVCSCHDGVTLINNVKRYNKWDSESFSETLINVFLVRDLLFQKSYCCTKELMTLWCDVQVTTNKSIDEVQEASRQLLNGHASSSAHFYVFIDCLWEKYGISLIPLYLEMFIRGLSSDLNFLEAARQADDKEAVIEIENNMAAVYLKISTLLCDISKEISLECMLSSFSLDPTQEKLDLIRRLSFQIASEKSKRILTNSRLKAAGKSRCGKDQHMRTVLSNGFPKRKNCVVTCDRGIQVGESSYVNDDVNSSFVKAYSSCHTVTSRSEEDIRCVLLSIISRVVESEVKSVSYQHSDSKQVMRTVKNLMDECLVHVVQEISLCSDHAAVLDVSKACKADDFIPLISNESSSELCMESASSMSEPSQEPPCLTPIYDEASLLNITGASDDGGEADNSAKTTSAINDAVNELIGVVVDALVHDGGSFAIKPLACNQRDSDTTRKALTNMVGFNAKNVGKLNSQHGMNSVDSRESCMSAVGNSLETKQVLLKLCDDKISKENSTFSNVCDIDFIRSIKDQPIITNGIAILNGNLSDSDKISTDISKSKEIIDPKIKINVNSITDTYNTNCTHPSFNSQSCDKTFVNTLQHVSNTNHHVAGECTDEEELILKSGLCNGSIHTKNYEIIASSGKVMSCNDISHSASRQIPTVACLTDNVSGSSNWTPSKSAGNVSDNRRQTPTISYCTENGDSRHTPTVSYSVTNINSNSRQTPTLCNSEIINVDDQSNEPGNWKRCCKMDHITLFHHVVLEAEIPGVSRALLSDFVIVLESLRNPQLRSTRRWNKLKEACKEYLQSVTSQRCKFLNSQLNDSVDSEGDSTSEMTAVGNREFASFQSDSVYNDPYVDRTQVLRRFMNDENSPKFNAFLNLADVQNLYMPLDKLLRADASSSHRDHLKHHRKHRNKDRDPKKQALRYLRHNSRHNRDLIKKKKKKRRKGKKDKSHSKKHHSTHNKNGRDIMTNKKKRRLKKKKESPVEFLPGDYCSDFSSAELMRLVNEHSNFPQATANSIPRLSNHISSGESDLLNCIPSKKKNKQVNFKKIKAKKNSVVKSHEKHKHSKSKPERKDKKKSPNLTKLNAVKDYSHIVQFSSVKQMQSVQIRQSSVAVDLADVNNDTQNNLTLASSAAHAENLESTVDPTVKTCSQEELMNIQMLLANKQANGDNEDRFRKSFVISSNKQSCSVLKYVSSKTTSRLLSVAQATNQLVMPDCEPTTSVNNNTLMPPGQFRPQDSKYLLGGKKISPAFEHISSKALVPISVCSSASKAQSRNIKKYTSPLITTVSFPMTQGMQPPGSKVVAGKFVIPLGGCMPSTSGTTTHSKIGEIMVTAGGGVRTSPKSNVFIVKGNTSPQLSVQSLLAASKNSNNLRIPLPPLISNMKNVSYLNKAKPNVVKKVVKKYIPVMQKSIINSETCLNKRKITTDFMSPVVTQHPEPLAVLPNDIPQSSLVKDSKPETVDSITKIDTPVTVSMATCSLTLNEMIKSIINELLIAVINSELLKADSIDINIPIYSTSVAVDTRKEEVPFHPTITDYTPESYGPLQTTVQSVKITTELPSEQNSDENALKSTIQPSKNSLKESGYADTMSENSSDSLLAATSLMNLKENVTAVKSIINSPEHKTTFFSESSSPFGTQTENSMITTFSTPRATSSSSTVAKANHSHSVEKLQPLTIGVVPTVRPHGVVASALNKVEGTSHTDTPTRSLASISDAVRFSLMDMDDATGSVENQVLQAFNAFPQEAVSYGSQVSEASVSALTASTSSQIVTQSSQTFQASIRTSQSESFAECQISASTTTEWNTNDPLVSPGASAKAHETDSAGELKDDEPIKKKRKKKDKIERDPETLQRFWCEICNRGFFSAYNLRRHCRNVHKMDLPKGTSDVPFTTSNSQCLAQVGARVICTTVPDSQEAQAVAQQLTIANKASEFILQSPTHDPKTKEFALQTSPPAHPKPIQTATQPLNQPSSFPLHSPPPSTVQIPTSLPISPVKDFRLQPVTSVALGQAQHSSFIPVTNTIPKPVPKFQRLPTGNTTTPPSHGLSRIGTTHQPSATSQTPQQTGIMQPSGPIQKPSETQTPNLVQPLPCQVQQIQQATQCALSQGKKQDQRVGMLQAAQHAAQEQAIRQARHVAELQQVQRAMQQAKKSVAASQLSKVEVLQQSQAQIQPTSAALSHLQSPILNPQMQKLVQIRQAALCGTPEFALQLSNQTGTPDLHTSPIKSPLQYFQAQVPSTQHPAILHSAVRQTLASCAATRQNQANQSFPGQQIQNMSNAEFLSRIVPHSNAERSSCSQTFPAMSAADLCLVSSQMHMPIIRQASETNEGLEDLEQFLLENMPWSGEQITSQGIVQHSLNRMGADPVALPIPVKPGTVVMQQPKSMPLTRNKQTISKPKPYKPPVSLTKNLGVSKGSSVKKKASSKKAAGALACSEASKTGFVPSVVNANVKNLTRCPKLGEKPLVGCASAITSEARVSSNLNENDSHSSDSVQCIEITQSSQPLKVRANNVSTSFNPFPQRESSGVTEVPGFYNVGLKRMDHTVHCAPSLAEAPRVSGNLLIGNLNSVPHVTNVQHMTTIPQPSSAISQRHPAIPPKPILNIHCNEHVLNLPSSKTQGTKINCSSKLPLKPSVRKFNEPLPKPRENLSPMDKSHDQVNPVIPIFDPNPLQNDNVDAEKEFNNLQSKISDCEKHLKNSQSKNDTTNNPENDKSIAMDSVTTKSSNSVDVAGEKEPKLKTQIAKDQTAYNNPEKKLGDVSPEKLASLNQKHSTSSDGLKLLSPEKVGKVPKGIHFLDEQTEPTRPDVKNQENKEVNIVKPEYKEAKSALTKNCVPEFNPTSHDSFAKGPVLIQNTILPFPYSHSEHAGTSGTGCGQNNSSNATCCNSTDAAANSTRLSSSSKSCPSAFENDEPEMCVAGSKGDLDQKNGNLMGGSSLHKSLEHVNKISENSVTENNKKFPSEKTYVIEQHAKSTTGLLVAEKTVYPNIFSPCKLIERNDNKAEESSTRNDNLLSPISTLVKDSTPINGKDITTEKEIMKCNMKQGNVQNFSFNSNAVRDIDANGDTEHTKPIDILLSPAKQGELDGPATIGRTRLRDTPKTSVKRSCPCCTDSSTLKKCLVRSSKILSPTKTNNSKAKNVLIVKTKVTNGPAVPVQTRSSHRLRSKTGT